MCWSESAHVQQQLAIIYTHSLSLYLLFWWGGHRIAQRRGGALHNVLKKRKMIGKLRRKVLFSLVVVVVRPGVCGWCRWMWKCVCAEMWTFTVKKLTKCQIQYKILHIVLYNILIFQIYMHIYECIYLILVHFWTRTVYIYMKVGGLKYTAPRDYRDNFY